MFDEKFDLHPTLSNSIFFFFFNFSKKIVFDDQLKCIKLCIKLASLMEFDEQFDTFAPALTQPNRELRNHELVNTHMYDISLFLYFFNFVVELCEIIEKISICAF